MLLNYSEKASEPTESVKQEKANPEDLVNELEENNDPSENVGNTIGDGLMASVRMTSLDPKHREILERHWSDTPIRLGEVARELGISVRMSGLPMGISGQIKKEEDRYVIRVNRDELFEHQRFTIAHELAHYFLHRDLIENSPDGIQDGILHRSGVPEKSEYEANRLAARILMPPELIKRKLAEFQSTVSEEGLLERMSDSFQVSHSAMKICLEKMGLP